MRKQIARLSLILAFLMLFISGCTVTYAPAAAAGPETAPSETELPDAGGIFIRFASAEEGRELLTDQPEYYAEFTQNKLEFVMQGKESSFEEYLDFAKEQVMDFTEDEKDRVTRCMADIQEKADGLGIKLPPLDTIIFVKTTQAEENYSGAYTHGTQIYLGEHVLAPGYGIRLERVLAHELFHCLTRCNPDFREKMYNIIHFTVQEKDYPLPPSVLEYFISNPDVEHHNSYASFEIDGEMTDCYTALVTTRHFEAPGDNFFECMTTGLVPVDGTDIYYTPEDAANFDEIFGTNTGYVIDPEECMADNFSFAVLYGMEGPGGKGYPNPEIIEGILKALS